MTTIRRIATTAFLTAAPVALLILETGGWRKP